MTSSSTYIERLGSLLFAHARWVLLGFGLLTVLFAYLATGLQTNASFARMIPQQHPFVQNFFKHEAELRPLGNVVRIVVHHRDGDIYHAQFLNLLRQITDEVFFIKGVDRGHLKSLWTPNVMWRVVTEEGVRMGPVIGQGFTGNAAELTQIRTHVEQAGIVGSLVSDEHRSALILVPLLEKDPDTGEPLNYQAFAKALEEKIRKPFEANLKAHGVDVSIHITGFAKLVGELIDGAYAVLGFFAITVLLTWALVLLFCRCPIYATATVLCCLVSVVWLLGAMRLLGLVLDPYSMLVPFLVFAIAVSHALQNVRSTVHAVALGQSPMVAAKGTFTELFLPGLVALLADAVGFATLLIIDIGVIQQLALSASLGVAVVIVTKMLMLPLIFAYLKPTHKAIKWHQSCHNITHPVWHSVANMLSGRKPTVLALGLVVACLGLSVYTHSMPIGDLHPGAPELRPDSRYNQDVQFLVNHFATTADVFVVMVETPEGECGSYEVASRVERLEWLMQNTPGVDSSMSLFTAMKRVLAGMNGGHPGWQAITRNPWLANGAHKTLPTTLFNARCSMVPVVFFLSDHKAETLSQVSQVAQTFANDYSDDTIRFKLAAGNAGIEAATNEVVGDAILRLVVLVYAVVALLVWLEFRSLRVCIAMLLPLWMTELLCKALMIHLELGVKVATLPVIALGVGIGVDYAIYLYNRLQSELAKGLAFGQAYCNTLRSTGGSVVYTALTLSLGVVLWVFSPIQFQADMGLLLAAMLLWNMLGAVVLMPAVLYALKAR